MDSIEKASFLMGKSYTKTQEGAAHSSNVTMITGTATSDSADGVVSVDLGGNTISDDDVQSVEISTTVNVKEGDTVQVNVIGADGTAKSLLVTGVIAGGDRMATEVDGASTAAGEAKTAAADAKSSATEAKSAADSAQSTANNTKTYFYNDDDGSHVKSQDSTTSGTRNDIKSDGMHIIDLNDSKELATFTSSGAQIGKDTEMHSKYAADGASYYKANETYPYARIAPRTFDNAKYSAAAFTASPDDISTDDDYYHSGATLNVDAINGTSADTSASANSVLVATTVKKSEPISASIGVHAMNTANSSDPYNSTNYVTIDAEKVFINNVRLPMIVQGSKVVYPNGNDYVALFTTDEMVSILGLGSWVDDTQDKITIAVQNGDADNSTVRCIACEYRGSTHTWYVTFNMAQAYGYRINYIIVYSG